MKGPSRASALAVLTLAPCVAALAPTPLPSHLGSDGAATRDPVAPLVALVGLAAWACTLWLLVVLALTCASRLPGSLGRLADALTRRLAPAAVRSLVRVALGSTVAVSVLSGPSVALAAASPAASPFPAPAIAGTAADPLDWPGLARPSAAPEPPGSPTPGPSITSTSPMRTTPAPARTTATSTGQPTAAEPRSPARPHPTATPAANPPHRAVPVEEPAQDPTARPLIGVPVHTVVVEQGDSLWRLAADQLGPTADARQVAQAWPRWWEANRAVLGDDPDLIHPGDRLTVPDPS